MNHHFKKHIKAIWHDDPNVHVVHNYT